MENRLLDIRKFRRGIGTSSFTLIELLCALAILTVILAALNSTLHSSMVIAERSRADSMSAERHTNLGDIVGRDLYNAVTGEDVALSFTVRNYEGQTGLLEFYTSYVLMGGREPAPVVKVGYRLEEVPGEAQEFLLVREETPASLRFNPTAEETSRLALTRIVLWRVKVHDGTSWKSTWNSEAGVPSRVSITYQLAGEREQRISKVLLLARCNM